MPVVLQEVKSGHVILELPPHRQQHLIEELLGCCNLLGVSLMKTKPRCPIKNFASSRQLLLSAAQAKVQCPAEHA